MFGTFNAPQLVTGGSMNDIETHPAVIAHRSGQSRPMIEGRDFQAFLVVLPQERGVEYIVTVWKDGDVGIQKV